MHNHEESPVALMQEHGVKPTANRILILKALLQAGRPLSLTEIETALESVDKSIISRTLAAFREHHLLHALSDGSGVRYDYWYPQRNGDPELDLNGRIDGAVNSTTIRIRNAPLLDPNLGKLLGIARNPEPQGRVRMYNYSAIYLEE